MLHVGIGDPPSPPRPRDGFEFSNAYNTRSNCRSRPPRFSMVKHYEAMLHAMIVDPHEEGLEF